MPWGEWRQWVLTADAMPMWERVAGVAARIAGEALGRMGPGEVLNVGIPRRRPHETPRRHTRVAAAGYDRLFAERSPGVYVHTYGGLVDDPSKLDGTDIRAAQDGVISITPIRGAGDGPVTDGLLEALTG